MIALALSAFWLILVLALLVRAWRQSRMFRSLPSSAPFASPLRIAVIVPARNEAANIEKCVGRILAQTYPAAQLTCLVIDDHSSDATPALVARLACDASNLHLISAPALPSGWIGKCHACWVGACTVPTGTDWLCFLDADVWAEPELLSAAMSEAIKNQLDFLSLAPRQELHSFAERLLMPCGFYLLSFLQDLRDAQEPESPEVAATGQFILVRREAYMALAGHAAVHAHICEDVALARLMKDAGRRVMFLGGDHLLSTRMYDGWISLWLGVTKNLVDMLGGPARSAWIAAAALALSWGAVLLPIWSGESCLKGQALTCAAFALAAPASLAAFSFHISGALFFGIPLWYGLTFPLGYTLGAVMALDSLRRRATGRVAWKGRTYP